jgi:hypothetical protein
MKLLVLVIVFLLAGTHRVFAAENEIIHVQRNLPMNEDEPIYKDYYISGGAQSGMKENMVVKVMRTIHVGKGGKAADGVKLEVPVGLLRIIYLRPQMAVARLYASQDIEKTPTLETPAILIGDTVELAGSFIDGKKPAVKPKEKKEVLKDSIKEVPKESSNEQNNSLPMENAGT